MPEPVPSVIRPWIPTSTPLAVCATCNVVPCGGPWPSTPPSPRSSWPAGCSFTACHWSPTARTKPPTSWRCSWPLSLSCWWSDRRRPAIPLVCNALEVLGALINGVVLGTVAVWIVVEAVRRLQHPSQVRGGGMLAVAALGLVANAFSAWLVARPRAEPQHGRRGRPPLLRCSGSAGHDRGRPAHHHRGC